MPPSQPPRPVLDTPERHRAKGVRRGGGAPRRFQWFWDAPASARRSLFAAWLGWLLDGFDVMLYALVLGTLIGDFSMSKATAGLLGSLTLIASGIGGILFGAIADR